MPEGIPYSTGKNVMQGGKKSMSQLMGIESKEHGKSVKNMKGLMKAETQEYGKRPSSKAALMKGEVKEHGKKVMPWMKGK